MHSTVLRGLSRFAIPLALLALLVTFLAATPSGAAHSNPGGPTAPPLQRVKASVSLSSVGERYVGAAIPIQGYVSNQSRGKHHLALQRRSVGSQRWVTVDHKRVRDGAYSFASQRSAKAGTVRFRTVLHTGRSSRSRVVDVSNVLRARVIALPAPPVTPPVPPTPPAPTCASSPSPTTCPKPVDTVQERVIDGTPYCQQLYVPLLHQERTITWVWDTTAAAWVQSTGTWQTTSQGKRPASAADCVHLIDRVPAEAALPDLRIKNLTKCGRGDLDKTGGDCFLVDPSAPYNPDFPSLEGKKLLKFPVITLNVPPEGSGGPAEVIADRTAGDDDPDAWRAYQTFYDAEGNNLGSVEDPGVQFYFAGDGHNHWHVRDFDNYYLLNEEGDQVRVAEKHGYCMQDNKTYDPWFNDDGSSDIPGVPFDDPNMPDSQKGVYWETTSCGSGLPNALSIVHGLSKGWGDTYPTTLPDQAIDITGVPDGTYTVVVEADAKGAVFESNDENNSASVQIEIHGDDVTVLAETAKGGI